MTIAATILTLALTATPVGHDAPTRTLGPITCGTQRCHQLVTTTRPWLDTGQTLTIIRRHARPVETRNGGTPPWGPWHLVVGYVS